MSREDNIKKLYDEVNKDGKGISKQTASKTLHKILLFHVEKKGLDPMDFDKNKDENIDE